MEIVLIRHGQPAWVDNGRSVVDPPLTELGHRQAVRLAERMVDEEFDEVLVSPLVRARETAAPWYERLGRDEVIEPWLEEIRDPDWHGSPAERAEKAYHELRRRPPDLYWQGLDGGESVRDFTVRIHAGATAFLHERGIERLEHELPYWRVAEPGRKIALVAHAGTNSITIAHLLGLRPAPWEWDRFVLGHASVSRLVAIPVGEHYTFSLTSLSNLEHIDRDERTR